MDLLKRFILYGFGLVIGVIFVFFIWDKKQIQFDYLPNARVMKRLRLEKHTFSKDATLNMLKIGIDTTDVNTVLQNGSVNFDKSSPRKKPCKIFFVDGVSKEKNLTLIVNKCDTISIIDKVILN